MNGQLKVNGEREFSKTISYYSTIFKKIFRELDKKTYKLHEYNELIQYFNTTLTPLEKKILLSENIDNYSVALEYLVSLKVKIDLEFSNLAKSDINSVKNYMQKIEGLINENEKALTAITTYLIKKGDKRGLDEISNLKFSVKNSVKKIYDLMKLKEGNGTHKEVDTLAFEFKTIYYYQNILLKYLGENKFNPPPVAINNYIKRITKWCELGSRLENGIFRKKIIEIVSFIFKLDNDASEIVKVRFQRIVDETYIRGEYLKAKYRYDEFQSYLTEKKKFFAISKELSGKHLIELIEADLLIVFKNFEKVSNTKLSVASKIESAIQQRVSDKRVEIARKNFVKAKIPRFYNVNFKSMIGYKSAFMVMLMVVTILSFAINFEFISFNKPYLSKSEVEHLFKFSKIEFKSGIIFATISEADWILLPYEKKQSNIERLLDTLKEKKISEFIITNERNEIKMKVLSNDYDLIASVTDGEEQMY